MCAKVCLDTKADLGLLQRNIGGRIMFDGIDARLDEDNVEQVVGSWRAVASAWALVLVFLLFLAGAGAWMSLHGGSQPDRPQAGVVIPHHDPCVGPGLPTASGANGCKTAPLGDNWGTYSNFW